MILVLCRAGFVMSSFITAVSACTPLVFLVQPEAEGKVPHSLTQQT